MVLKGQEESESSSSRNFLLRFCFLLQNVNKSALLFFSPRIKERHYSEEKKRRPVLMVGWEVTVRKIATASNNVHINMCTKLSEKNCSQE